MTISDSEIAKVVRFSAEKPEESLQAPLSERLGYGLRYLASLASGVIRGDTPLYRHLHDVRMDPRLARRVGGGFIVASVVASALGLVSEIGETNDTPNQKQETEQLIACVRPTYNQFLADEQLPPAGPSREEIVDAAVSGCLSQTEYQQLSVDEALQAAHKTFLGNPSN